MQEEELIAACKNYNPAAQRIVYQKYYSVFFKLCIRYVADPEEAKDIVQDTFIKIFSTIGKFKSEGSFEGWMKRIVVNDTLSYLKKKNKRQTKTFSDLSEADIDEIIDIDTVEEDNENTKHNFTEEELLNAIKSIPDNLRTVFNLACIEGYSHKEIASLLSISEENSRIRLMNARQKVRKFLYPQSSILSR